MLHIRDQPAQLGPAQADGQVFRVNSMDQYGDADQTRHQRRQCRTGNPHGRDWPYPQNENRIEHDIQRDIEDRIPKRRHRIPHPAQGRREQDHDERHGHTEENHAQIGKRERERLRRRRQQMEQLRGKYPTQRRRHHPRNPEHPHCTANRPPHILNITPAHRLADQDGGGHRKAEQGGEHQEHDHPRVRCRGQRFLAKETPDPDRVD